MVGNIPFITTNGPKNLLFLPYVCVYNLVFSHCQFKKNYYYSVSILYMYYFNRIPDISLYQLPSFLAQSSLFKTGLPKLTFKKQKTNLIMSSYFGRSSLMSSPPTPWVETMKKMFQSKWEIAPLSSPFNPCICHKDYVTISPADFYIFVRRQAVS